MPRPHFSEWLDGPDVPPAEAARSLADLRRINRWLGGERVLLKLLESEARRAKLDRFSLLDVGAGSGDLGAAVEARFPGARVVLCDRKPHHLTASDCGPAASGLRPRDPDPRSLAPGPQPPAPDPWPLASGPRPEAPGSPAPGPRQLACGSSVRGLLAVGADAEQLPFRDRSFDFVAASLMLHHFRDNNVVRLLQLLGRVARRAVLVNDLERHWFPRLFIQVSAPIFARSYVTRHDAPASVRQAFLPQELGDLARAAGFGDITVRRHRPWFRLSLVARCHA